MHKGLQVVLYLVAYCLAAWLWRETPWSPRPLLTPDAVAAFVSPWSEEAAAAAPSGVSPPKGSRTRALSAAPLLQPEVEPELEVTVEVAGPAPHSWKGFLHKLRELELGERDKVRVVHLGDSELVADGTSASLRTMMAARFGLGGLGFSLAAKPLPWYQHEHWRHREGTGLTVYSFPFGKLADGMYGPGGVAFDAAPGGKAHATLSHPAAGPCRLRFYFAFIPRGGEIALIADGFAFATVDTDRWRRGVGVLEQRFDDCPDDVELLTKKRHARFYGWSVDYDQPGVVWSSLGVVSAQLPQLAHYEPAHLVEALLVHAPDLVVTTFGLNLASTPHPPPPSYQREVTTVLERIREGLPQAACLVIGPYPVGYPTAEGGVSPESISAEVVSRHQRAAAESVGCVFLDRYRLAGGAPTARRWVAAYPKILTGDYQHLTLEGSERMGRAIASVLLSSYDGVQIDARLRFALDDPRNASEPN